LEPSKLEDHELVGLALEGRESAFRELLARYERPIYTQIWRMVRDTGLAEDLAQEAFVRAFRALPSYNPQHRFSSWIFRVAHNLTIDHLRKKRLDTVSLDAPRLGSQPEASPALQVASPGASPEEETLNRELGAQIETAIDALRPEYRAAILLRHVEGRSYEEVAEILELPLGTVKTYIHRGRLELRELLEGVLA
jgi:RNA polymerase sigma-70 factor, ECF subfamily